MSCIDNARATLAIANNVGIRWCSSCQSDKPAEGFKKLRSRWICTGCQVRRNNGKPPRILSSINRGI